MAVQQNKKSPSKRGMRRAHDFLTNPPLAVEPTTGELLARGGWQGLAQQQHQRVFVQCPLALLLGQRDAGAFQQGLRQPGIQLGGCAVAQFQVLGDARGELDELVIQEGDAAFNAGRHAHLILFHQQFHQIGFSVRE